MIGDKQTTIAVRIIGDWQPLPAGASLFQQAFMFALCDGRDMTFDAKLVDALSFFKSRVTH